jgi:hypothetical protein
MPLLASPHKQALRQLLSQGGSATPAEIQIGTGMTREQAIASLESLERTGLATSTSGTPGLGSGRWRLTAHALEVGWSLVADEPEVEPDEDRPVEPAEGWGFPWKPAKPEEPLYAVDLPRRARRELVKAREQALALRVQQIERPRRRVWLLALGVFVTVVGAGALLLALRQVDIEVRGIEDGVALQPAAIEGQRISFTIDGGDPDSAVLLLDGFPVSGVQHYGDQVAWVVPPLTEGDHSVSVTVDRPLWGQATERVRFSVDGTPPDLGIPEVHEPVPLGEPVRIAGTVEPGVNLIIGGVPIEVTDGEFVVELSKPPPGPVPVLAIDRAGNTTAFDLVVPVAYPATTGVHVSAAAWAHDGLRSEILDLIDQGKITAVELDLKDERGFIEYDSEIPLAHAAGAVVERFVLEEAIADLHARGVRVIGRLVAFRDPVLAQYAWDNGDTDWVIQDANGQPWASYGGFTNFGNEAVRQYNLDIALEAAAAGIDDILWDYIRRPEGDLDRMLIPGLDGGDPSPVIVDFVAEAQVALREYDVFQGVSVFGIAANRGEYIAQDVRGMAPHVDYVAPMVYPSHWGPGEYGVANPEAQPYDIVLASLRDFQEVLAGTNTALVPWLQDFTLRIDYGPAEVKAQIDAAADLGISDWLLWDPNVTYTGDGISTTSPGPRD